MREEDNNEERFEKESKHVKCGVVSNVLVFFLQLLDLEDSKEF